MKKIFITEYSAVCNLGADIKEIFKNAICADNSHFNFDENFIKGLKFPLGKIETAMPEINNKKYNTGCNSLLLHCLKQLDTARILKKYNNSKIGVIIATTNSGVEEFAESRNKDCLEIGNPSEFVKNYLNLKGVHSSISVACASGTKAFSMARRLLNNDICDCVIVGGSDALSHLAIHGFNSLELLSKEKSVPFSQNRNGINIGEGAAVFIVEKEPLNNFSVEIAGLGETSDAYHYSTPEPTGAQAVVAVKNALKEAKIKPENIDYINLHGTGTITNDLMEANTVNKIFEDKIYASSTKPLTGHCLGAAAALETAMCCALLSEINTDKIIYPHIYDENYDGTLPAIKLATKNTKLKKLNTILSNSFGFGGANAVIILRRTENVRI